ncbi:uncharacterized protein LOC125372917 [Haliotis rufescens]|uniref:uncharacterized protein LOC125372917 n=1 Tax=Haliotis rufescens TaxID=6454 RepID=UPI00201E9497|nr:uncharacterized protein LOC125372917 [Haliotis rufescens]
MTSHTSYFAPAIISSSLFYIQVTLCSKSWIVELCFLRGQWQKNTTAFQEIHTEILGVLRTTPNTPGAVNDANKNGSKQNQRKKILTINNLESCKSFLKILKSPQK